MKAIVQGCPKLKRLEFVMLGDDSGIIDALVEGVFAQQLHALNDMCLLLHVV